MMAGCNMLKKSINESSRQEIGILGVEKAKELDPSDSSDRSMDTPILNVSVVQANVEEVNVPTTLPPEPIVAIQEPEPILDTHASTSRETLTWRPEDRDAPKGGFAAFFLSFLSIQIKELAYNS
ncbi:protein VASCULAR ASSOCIATED DEATH 1 [Cucumis melo var. makuwa]|uniref:Protein VASCULAR ASSOCIATED DEATH 1 n=1 Tax=Cucumis melo var. makuwa TaxID=1194695 RepID=A0A5D3DAY9_CUCMM|nr:protein VASCULAR ASSOCIATED DEATH 1 [Cucumis melo var. makuwa]